MFSAPAFSLDFSVEFGGGVSFWENVNSMDLALIAKPRISEEFWAQGSAELSYLVEGKSGGDVTGASVNLYTVGGSYVIPFHSAFFRLGALMGLAHSNFSLDGAKVNYNEFVVGPLVGLDIDLAAHWTFGVELSYLSSLSFLSADDRVYRTRFGLSTGYLF